VSRRTAPIQIGFEPEGCQGAIVDDRVLARIRFGTASAVNHDPRQLSLALPPQGGNGLVEVWHGDAPVQHGWEGGFGYAHSGEALFFQLLLDEAAYPSLTEASADAYARLQAFLAQAGYPSLLRLWVYFPRINAGEGPAERYQQFCLGRGQVLERASGYEARLPAATVIGSLAPGLVLYGLAAHEPGQQVENPRQLSAFHYPRQYAPRSPAFSRARLKRWGALWHLYVSGTASVVGHETRHPHAALAQLREVMRNLESLLEQASRTEPSLPPGHLPDLAMLKLYVRPGVDISPLQAMLQEILGTQACLILAGDACRRALLVELEGFYAAPAQPALERPGTDRLLKNVARGRQAGAT
jgi:chorismate lyase/3-hydroxybenzoate synthase